MNELIGSYMQSSNIEGLTVRALTEVESLILSTRHENAFFALSQLSAGVQSGSPALQAANLIGFTIEHAALIEDVIAYGTDQQTNREAISQMSPDVKLIAFGQILAMTGAAMQAADSQVSSAVPSPSHAVH